jgi:rubrerythrin
MFLYHKRHTLTGLNYFGKTYRNPYEYYGSGIRWTNHLKKHGYNVETIKIWKFKNLSKLTNFALNFSKKNNIVKSKKWANLMEENGLDGITPTLAKKINKERVKNRTHHLLGGAVTKKQLRDGTHPSQNPVSVEKIRQKTLKQITEGKNHFAGKKGSILSKKVQRQRIKNRTHHLLGSSHSMKALSKGIHPSQNPISIKKQELAAIQRLKQGIHPSQYSWTCKLCNHIGKGKSNQKQHNNRFCKNKNNE